MSVSLGESTRPPAPLPGEVTRLLRAWSAGDAAAFEELIPLVYENLRRLARRYLDSESDALTLQATALVNEVYLRLHGLSAIDWRDREHFFSFAARTLRRILVDHARTRRAGRRGGGRRPLPLLEEALAAVGPDLDLLALDAALARLAAEDPRLAHLVELRFFVGLTIEETSRAMNVSTMTVKRDWKTARMWLYREMRQRPVGGRGGKPQPVKRSHSRPLTLA